MRAQTQVARATIFGALCVWLAAIILPLGCRSESESEPTPDSLATVPQTGRPSAAGDPTTVSLANVARLERPTEPVDPGSCLTGGCHQEHLRRQYRHAPVEAGACDRCHLPEQPGHTFPIRQTSAKLCDACHDTAEAKTHEHPVIEQEGCLPCHDPHGSNVRHLLTDMSMEMICQRCHRTERKQHLHSEFASGSCTACHEPHGGDYPALLILGEGKEHCLGCHTQRAHRLASSTYIHKPIMETGCVDCHIHHSSDYQHLLTKPLYNLCVGCHAPIESAITSTASPHGAVFTGQHCANCHESHEGDRPYLLRDEQRTLCLRCHNQAQQATDGHIIPDMTPVLVHARFLHGPIRAGNCNACHYTHASRYTMLLRNYFPREFYESFDLADYALCFKCHSESTVLEGSGASYTGFRNGSTNLHYVHVNRADKGRTCRTCHELHGSNLTKHMASAVPFEGGGWAMPIRMQSTETGGRCSPGCHEPRNYNRTPDPIDGSSSHPPDQENSEAGKP